MKVNWGALGVTIAVLFLAVSILTVGLVVGTKVSKLEQGLEEQIAIVKTSIKRDIIAQGYAFSKAESEKRGIILEDLNQGYGMAKELMEQTTIAN